MSEPPSRPDLGFPAPPPVPGSTVRRGLDGRPLATWNPWQVVGIVLLGFVLGSLAAVPVYLLMGQSASTCEGAAGASELLQGVVTDLVMLLTLYVWLQRRHRTWPQIIGFPVRSDYPKEIAVGAGLGLVVRIVAGIASAAIVAVLQRATHESVSLPEQVCATMSGGTIALFALYAVLIAPVTEEFVFRGLLYRSIRDRIGVAAGAIISAIAFGLIHYIPGNPWRDVVSLQLTMVVTGVGLALIYERRGTIVADIAGHAAFNLLAVILIATGSAVVPGFLR
jgi:membrane protease YdiL (CAAX protease family)